MCAHLWRADACAQGVPVARTAGSPYVYGSNGDSQEYARVHGKLVDNFSPESDVTSLQDSVTSRPYLDTSLEDSFYSRASSVKFHSSKNNEWPASSFPDLLASCRAVLVMRIQLGLSLDCNYYSPTSLS